MIFEIQKVITYTGKSLYAVSVSKVVSEMLDDKLTEQVIVIMFRFHNIILYFAEV